MIFYDEAFRKLYEANPECREALIERSGIISDGCGVDYSVSDAIAAEMIGGNDD